MSESDSDNEQVTTTDYTLLPFLREGFRPDRVYSGSRPVRKGRNEFTVRTHVKGRKRDGSGTETKSRDVTLRMYGPGDISGIDDDQVVRTVPKPDTTTFPPTYFPHIEFARPDLLWLFSPESSDPDDGHKIRPWLTLVVVPKEGETKIEPPGTRPNPVLKVPTSELPPAEESWAWAHVQVVGDVFSDGLDQSDQEKLFSTGSDQSVCRLLCPRKLSTGTKYVACVVPAFEPGRKAGLGTDPFGDLGEKETPRIGPAWDVSADKTVELPVYYRWEFTTGDRGDFEAALDKLVPRNLSKPEYEVGYREIDIAEPGPEPLRTTGTATARVTGALTTVGPEPTTWGQVAELYDLLTAPDNLLGTPADSPARNLPVITPPEYGKWPPLALQWQRDPPTERQWLADLNLTPRYRLAAGLGTQVIRENQEQLVTDAWAQFDQLEDDTRSVLDRYRIGKEIERESQVTLERVDQVRQYRSFERVRDAIRVQETLEGVHVGEGGIDVDPRVSGVDFGRDIAESILRNGGMSGPMEDVLGGVLTDGRTQPPVEETTQPPVDETTVPGSGDGYRADQMLDGQYGSFLSVAKELGRVRVQRASERGDGVPSRPDGGSGGIDDRIPDFGNLSRVDAITRPGGLLARRANADTDMSAIRESLFAEGPVPDTGSRSDGAEMVAPAWLRDESGERMTLSASAETLSADMKAVPMALLRLRTLRRTAGDVRDRLDAVASELGSPGEDGIPDGQAAAAQVVLEEPRVSVQAESIVGLLEKAKESLSTAVNADLSAVSSELTPEQVNMSFEQMETAEAALSAAVERIVAGAERAVSGEDGGGAAIRHADLDTARTVAAVIVEQAEALAAYIPTAVERSPDSTETEERRLPDSGPDVPRKLLYEEIPLENQPNIPGILAGERWTVAKTGKTAFGTSFADDQLEQVEQVMQQGPMAAPEFDRPMYEPLKQLSTDHILPGVGNVPNNTIGALTTNRDFIESYMAGLSHELGRELLWREFPTDRRATYFRTFWDYDGPGDKPAPHDIKKIHTWEKNLGTNAPGESKESNRVVLLLKGDLLQAFPNTRIYMVPAVAERRDDAPSPSETTDGHEIWDRKPLFDSEPFDVGSRSPYDRNSRPGRYEDGEKDRPGASITTTDGVRHVVPKEPIVQGKLGDSVTFLLFDLDVDAARGKDFTFKSNTTPKHPEQLGWFFVFEEPVGEIRFGLDANAEIHDDDVRDAAHPTREEYSGDEQLYTDVGSYPAKVRLKSESGSDADRTRSSVDGCEDWQEGSGEEEGWSGLSWGHLVRHGDVPAPKEDGKAQIEAEQKLVGGITHVRVAGSESHAPGGVNDGLDDDTPWSTAAASWGENSANMARITWQYPIRAAYHVDDLLPEDTRDGLSNGTTNRGESS